MEEKFPGLPPEINTEDPIARALTNFFNFCVQNSKKLIFAGLCLFVLFAGLTGFFSWKNRQEAEVVADLGILMLEAGRTGDDSHILTELQKLGEEKASAWAGQIANLYAARLLAERGEMASSLANYNKALVSLGKNPFLKNMILWERAYIHLALEDSQAALSDFSALSSEKSPFQESALYHVFRMEAAAGNQGKSDDAHAKLLELYPDSLYQLFDV